MKPPDFKPPTVTEELKTMVQRRLADPHDEEANDYFMEWVEEEIGFIHWNKQAREARKRRARDRRQNNKDREPGK